MKILLASKKYPEALAGDSVVVEALENEYRKIGDEVYVLTNNCDVIRNGSKIIKFGLKDKPEALDRITIKRIISLKILFFKSFSLLRKIKPDVVHSHSPDISYALSFACRWYKIPLINTCHGVSFHDKQYSFFKRSLEKFFLKVSGIKTIITVDPTTLKAFQNAGIKNAVYIPNGVDTKLFKPGKKPKKIVFITNARLEKQKNLDALIVAAENLKKLDFEIRIIGYGSLEKELKDLVKQRGVTDKVVFLGKIKRGQVAKEYQKASAFVLPSVWEGMPLVILEAWASGLPVITTNVGAVPVICKDGENALVVPARDDKELTNAMRRIITNKKLADKIAKNGLKEAQNKYNWKNIAQTTRQTYIEAEQ